MRFTPALAAFSCAVVLVSCGKKAPDEAEIEKRVQERLAEEHQAQEQKALQDRQAALDAREQALKEREQQVSQPAPEAPPDAAAVPQAPPDGIQSFYDALASYGEWIEMPNYGYVWQPQETARDPNWRPYTNGHFAYTDYGWTWISQEPYGWITYHYGRWMRTHQLRWIWVPGDQWAPAWVSWRYGNGYVGWAPLPPEAQFDGPGGIQQWADARYQLGASDYTFVPASEFGDDSMAAVALPPDQNQPVYDDSSNVTDIVYDSPSIIYCYGPNWDFIREKSRRPPPRFRINRVGFGGKNGAFVSNGTLEITAPVIGKGSTRAIPPVVRGRFTDSRVVTITPVSTAPRATPPVFSGSPAGVVPTPARAPFPNTYRPVATPYPGGPVAGGMHYPTRMSPVPVPSAVAEQKEQEAQRLPASTPVATHSAHGPVQPNPETAQQAAERSRQEQLNAERIQQQQAAEQERRRQQESAEQDRHAAAQQAMAEKAQAEAAAAAKAEAIRQQAESNAVPGASVAPGGVSRH